jgi:hypothetical protein
MKIVLRHKITGRYYQAPGKWVRRADNALTFENVGAAREFSRLHHLLEVQPVQRLAPYLMPLIEKRHQSMWAGWMHQRYSNYYLHRSSKFIGN